MPDSNRPSLTEQIDEDEAWLAANDDDAVLHQRPHPRLRHRRW